MAAMFWKNILPPFLGLNPLQLYSSHTGVHSGVITEKTIIAYSPPKNLKPYELYPCFHIMIHVLKNYTISSI
jgi:hypothetical protein